MSLYSSIPLLRSSAVRCLSCAVLDISSSSSREIITTLAQTPSTRAFEGQDSQSVSSTLPQIPAVPPDGAFQPYEEIALEPLFPGGGFTDPPGYPYGVYSLPPAPFDRWIYSPSDNPASVDNNLEINGQRVVFPPIAGSIDGQPYSVAGLLNGGETTLLAFIPANTSWTLTLYNGGGSYSANGVLRLFRSPIL